MFATMKHLPINRSLPPSYKDVWRFFEEEEKLNSTTNDGGKARRTAFICAFEDTRNDRLIALKECESLSLVKELKSKAFVFGENRLSSKSSFVNQCTLFKSRLVKPDYIKLLVFTFLIALIHLKNDRKKLPVYAKRDHVLEIIENNQVVIVSGETGR